MTISKAYSVGNKPNEVVSVVDFGAKGDGVTDDTAAIQAAVGSGISKTIICEAGKNYKITSGVYLPDNTTLDLNGSTIQCYPVGETRCIVLDGDNTTIENGSVINNTVEAGLSADFQTPVMIGSLRDGGSRRNCVAQNLYLDTKQPNGRCIIAYGDVSNVVIKNIEVPSSSNIGRIVAVHWGSLGVSPVAQTFHGHNIKIENIHCPSLTNNSSDAGLVFISGAYDVDISNIYGGEVPDGYLVRVFCGDYGYQYAQTTTEQDLAGQGVRIKNIFGKAKIALQVAMKNSAGAAIQEWPVNVELSGAGVKGYGATDTGSWGLYVTDCADVSMHDCTLDEFYYGAFMSARSKRTYVYNNVFRSCVNSGIQCRGAASGNASNVKIRDNSFRGTSVYDIYLEYCDDVLIDGNRFVSPGATRSVFANATNKPTDVKVVNNHVEDCSGTPFVFGTSTTTGCCILFNGNTLDSALGTNIKGGQESVPYALTAGRNSGLYQKVYYSDRAPIYEPSQIGDITWNTGATASGTAGWICVTAGTPGTWKTFGTISA